MEMTLLMLKLPSPRLFTKENKEEEREGGGRESENKM